MDLEKISLIAQKIIFAFEDFYLDKEKRSFIEAIFDQYLLPLDPDGIMEPYDAIILLGRKNHSQFEQMVTELKEHSLISD